MFRDTQDIKEAARGRWRGILQSVGVPSELLPPRPDKHGPCPMCGGEDRFRFDDKDGRGTWFCNQCGAGDGFTMLERFKGWSFKEAVSELRQILGIKEIPRDAPPKRESPEDLHQRVKRMWAGGRRVEPGDPVDLYLRRRGLGMDIYPAVLRYHPDCPCDRDHRGPAMLAAVTDETGHGINVHRTFLTLDGQKAEIQTPKRVMKGQLPHGAAVRLASAGYVMGIAEGVETALAASRLFGIPVWAAISAALLAEWRPPAAVRKVLVFGDNDPKFGGQKAAYILAHRLAISGLDVETMIPATVGTDWADVLLKGAKSEGAPEGPLSGRLDQAAHGRLCHG